MSITKNTVYNLLKKRTFETGDTGEFFTSLSYQDNYNIEFYEMLICLNEIDRKIVTLHIVNGLKHKDIAYILELSHDIVRKRYSRALTMIKNNL